MTLREILETWEPDREVSLFWLWESPGGYHYDTIRGEWIQGHGRDARSADAGQGKPDFLPDLPQIDPEYCYCGDFLTVRRLPETGRHGRQSAGENNDVKKRSMSEKSTYRTLKPDIKKDPTEGDPERGEP